MKKQNVLMASLLAISMAGICGQASAFGLGDLTKAAGVSASSNSSSVSVGDVDAFITTAKHAELLINGSAELIFKALASQEEKAKYEAAMKAANEIADPKEKEAKLEQIHADTATSLQKSLNNEQTLASVKKMSNEQRKHLASSAFNFMLGLMKDKELAARSTGLVSSVAANPSMIGKLASLKDAASSVSSQVQNAAKIADGLVKMAKAGNMKVMPASTSEKPVAVQSM